MSEEVIFGLSATEWQAAFRPGLPEFAATTFAFTREGANLVRIAFGNDGPYMSPAKRTPVYSVAIVLPPDVAVSLANMLLKHYAEPDASRSKTSGQL